MRVTLEHANDSLNKNPPVLHVCAVQIYSRASVERLIKHITMEMNTLWPKEKSQPEKKK